MPRRNPTAAAAVLGLALFLGSAPAGAVTAFEPATTLQGTRLQLNGAGTRYKAIFRVYDMGLYTTRKVGTPEELLALPGPKRMLFTMQRELSTTDLGRLFMRGMTDNSSETEVRQHSPSMMRFIDLFSVRPKLNTGDTFAIDFVPGRGTQFYLNGKPQGDAVSDDEFFNIVLRIWFGPSPADRLLERALLGRDAER